jgi:hypothetical protein
MKEGHERVTTQTPIPQPKQARRRRGWRRLGLLVLILVVLAALGRATMPSLVRDYVNRTLDKNQMYSGNIGTVRIHLLRGAYSIEDVRVSKTTGNVPVPFFSARRVDFAVQWDALFHGKVVGRILMENPEINFVDGPGAGDSQSGAGGPWLQIIRDLFPFRINSAVVKNGAVHFRAFQTEEPVDVYLSEVEATVDNLTNIRDETKLLVSTVRVEALAMDQAKFEYNMALDPFSYRPTFHMALRVLGLDVTRINDFALAYGNFDFKRGWFDLVIEADAKEGQIRGYVKPLFRNLKVFSLKEDLEESNVLQFFWQALLGAATTLFKNQPRDQFGTLIPFTSDDSGATSTDILATIGNILRNAFIRAYLPRLEGGEQPELLQGLKFEPPNVSDPVSPGETP